MPALPPLGDQRLTTFFFPRSASERYGTLVPLTPPAFSTILVDMSARVSQVWKCAARAVSLAVALSCLIPAAHADDRTQRLVERLQEEAYAFNKIATEVIGTETLHQRAQKPPSRFRFRIRVGKRGDKPEWQERDIVSEYGFTRFADGALHELRQVRSVDGKPVKGGMSTEDLAKLVLADDDERKRDLLEQFEKYGLVGAANDFGQLLLLFSPGNIEQYEFVHVRTDLIDGARAEVFSYKQIDGDDSVTVVDARHKEVQQFDLEGFIWVTQDDYTPIQISIDVRQNAFDKLDRDQRIRQRATVTYAKSRYGALLPVTTAHRDFRGSNMVAENHFTYTDFKKFGASSEINFDISDESPEADGKQEGSTPDAGPAHDSNTTDIIAPEP